MSGLKHDFSDAGDNMKQLADQLESPKVKGMADFDNNPSLGNHREWLKLHAMQHVQLI